ncbi:MAG: cation:proton antiporter [Methanomassiliicoccus sp.]|nr:cation:proton antiporter [Methanomassiliicoccus sp.]
MDTETRLILDIALILGSAGLLSILFGKLKMPTVIGYLAGGVLLGSVVVPGVAMDQSTLSIFSTIGVILLMFFIGIELNLRGLRHTGPSAFLIVSIEMTLMVILGYYFGLIIGLEEVQAVFLGAIISGASTAAVLLVAKENGHIDRDLSRALMSIMVFEDIGQIVILTLASPLATGTVAAPGTEYWIILEIIAFMGLSILVGLMVLPRGLDWLRRNYSKETVLIVSLALCFVMAFISGYIGLSVAIGAFLAGLIVSESTCNNLIRRRIEPMKEVFIAIFFIAIGMRIDVGLVLDNILLCLGIATVFIVGKFSTILFASYLTTMDLRSSFYLATSMVAMGEFGFIIATLGLSAGILDLGLYSTVIGAALITMIVLPLLSRSGPRIYDRTSRAAPSWAHEIVRRMERVRAEVRRKMSISPEFRLEVRQQLLLVFVDLIFIISILIGLNLISPVNDLIAPLAGELHLLPALLLFMITVVLISPVVVNIVARLRLIAFIIMINVSEGGRHSISGRMRIYRIFRNVGQLFMIAVLLLLLVPFLPPVGALDLFAVLALLGVVVSLSALSWGVLRPAFNRASSAFVAKMVLLDDDEDSPAESKYCEE